MAARALNAFGIAMHVGSVNGLRDRRMTVAARSLHHAVIKPGDLNIVWIFARGEIKGMEEAVAGLHSIFPDEVMRSVTIVTCGGRMVTGFYPAAVLIVHHMAVGASAGVVQQVGIAFGVNKRVTAGAHSRADQAEQRDVQC